MLIVGNLNGFSTYSHGLSVNCKRFQSLSVDISHFQSVPSPSIIFNHLQSLWLSRKHRNSLTVGRWGKQRLMFGKRLQESVDIQQMLKCTGSEWHENFARPHKGHYEDPQKNAKQISKPGYHPNFQKERMLLESKAILAAISEWNCTNDLSHAKQNSWSESQSNTRNLREGKISAQIPARFLENWGAKASWTRDTLTKKVCRPWHPLSLVSNPAYIYLYIYMCIYIYIPLVIYLLFFSLTCAWLWLENVWHVATIQLWLRLLHWTLDLCCASLVARRPSHANLLESLWRNRAS